MNTSGTNNEIENKNVREFREIFSLLDRDGGGSICMEELGQLLLIIGIDATEDETKKILEEFDTDKSGEVEFNEFLTVMRRRVKAGRFTSQEISHAFDIANENQKSITDTSDENNTTEGKLHLDTLVDFLTTSDDKVGVGTKQCSKERAMELVMQMDVDRDGYIDYKEYVDVMMNW